MAAPDAPARSLPVKILIASVAEAVLLTFTIPQYLPKSPLLWLLIRLLAVNFALYLVYRTIIYPFFLSPLRHLPQPKGGRFILNHSGSMFRRPPGSDFLKWITETPNDGMLLFRGIGNFENLIVTDPKVLSDVLVHKAYDFVKPAPVRNFLRGVLGNGLIIVEGDEHKFQRKHILPSFSFRHIKEMYPMMWKKAEQLAEGVVAEIQADPLPGSDEKAPVKIVEINHWANKVTMDIIGIAGLGKEFQTLMLPDEDQHPLIRNYEEILEPTMEKNLYFAARIMAPPALIKKLPWKLNQVFETVTGNLTRICGDLVRAKREEVAKGGQHFDILSVLIKSNNFSDAQLVDQMLTFLAAGHETTSSAFTWVCFLLTTRPDIQSKLRQEILDNVPAGSGNNSDLAQLLESLPLLNAVCNETLRLYPTVPVTVRVSARPTVLENIVIPRDTPIILCPWAINRTPKLWGPDAEEFRPERWINPDGKPNNTGGAQSNYSQLTFLHGPRSCIGKDFAKAELRCLIAIFIKVFEIELGMPREKVIPGGVITSKPEHGMHLKLKIIPQ